ncbi:uncharacterized protein N7484_006937 [Penicillium longicatenatum]|uniref:uncharacterized protein n=1 Tax=Penicillium longicatenatum TaxID=1561947 RepID=UPI0025469132|nr:uncharacterized protein N7484_006937 [Penicillium longicatenatum]KAJ5639075.1 hypothetical protein N7484_006937 [Penicillium longicatenatum]
MDSSGSKDKKPVPKFGSFKLPSAIDTTESPNHPQSNSELADSKARSSRRSDRSTRERLHDHPSRSHHSRHSSSKDHHHSRNRPPSSKRDLPIEQSSSIELSRTQGGHWLPDRVLAVQLNNPGSNLPERADTVSTTNDSNHDSSPEFFLDSKGDRDILTYGIENRWGVPRYRRTGGGFILGLGRTHRIDRDQSHGDQIVLRPCAFADSSLRDGEHNLSFKPSKLPLPEYHIRGSAVSALGVDDDFVLIGGEDWDPPEIEQTTEQIGLDAERKTRNATLWKTVEDNPQDVGAWLRFIDHQNVLILGSRDETQCLTHDERTSLADLKLSLHEKALKKATESPHRDRLLLGRLQAGAQLWDSEKLLAQWKKTLLENPEFISLWVKFLDFCQTDSPDFTFGKCLALHEEYLSHVSSLIPLRPNMVQVLVYIFLRLTLLFREAGYSEIAVGLWQAVLEFCCFKPDFLDDFDQTLSLFREFWDSEVPRIGEDGAKGWSNNTSSDPDPKTTHYSFTFSLASNVASWVEAEREHIMESQLPWRSLDGSIPNVDDPYKVTLFCDVDQIIRLFRNLAQSDELIDAFLYFSQLPHLTFPSNIQTTRVWGWDNLLRNEFVTDHRLGLSSWIPLRDEESDKPAKPFLYPLQNFLHTTATLFASPCRWFHSFQWWVKSRSVQPPLKTHDWTLRVLRVLVDRYPDDEELAEYFLALEFASNPVMGRKFAKKTVKKRPSSLRLWNAFALMESRSEDDEGRKKANGVWATALSMSVTFTDTEQKADRAILWQSWIWQFMERGEKAQALYVLHNIAEEKLDPEQIPKEESSSSFHPTTIVKVQRYLQACQGQALAARRAQAYVAYTDCLGLIYYLAKWPLMSTLDIYGNAVLRLKELSPDEEAFKEFTAELLHQARARVLYDCLCQKEQDHSPLEIHELLRESTALFPHNTIFQSMSMWNEFRITSLDRLRDPLKFTKEAIDNQYQLDQASSPIIPPQSVPISSYLLPIWIQLSSPRSTTGPASWIVRPAFEKALSEVLNPAEFRSGGAAVRSRFGVESARSNLTIWKLYMLYERYHVKDLEAAKAVFFRAIRACPWSKELIMFAFEHLSGGMSIPPGEIPPKGKGLEEDELRRLVLVLGERQLRLHVPIKLEANSPDRFEETQGS